MASVKAPPVKTAATKAVDPAEILREWEHADGARSTELTKTMIENHIWPSEFIEERERMAGIYPDPEDPMFAARLFNKREFHEARAIAASLIDGDVDPCDMTDTVEQVFELTPVQRIVSRFMHPKTPYMGLLLFHGVGVGKTCSAVTMSEEYLAVNPKKKVIMIVPQALQENMRRTIFNADKLKWNSESKTWSAHQCTGISYLKRLGLLSNPDIKSVALKVEKDINKRYTIVGYQAFANDIRRTLDGAIPKGLPEVKKRELRNNLLRERFSDCMLIIDEAHNLRDISDPTEDVEKAAETEAATATATATGTGDAKENAGGKALNPLLKQIVLYAEGLRLVLMTATPMYNSAPEIVLLLNFLHMNDLKREDPEFTMNTVFADGRLSKKGRVLLSNMARKYVSYMRGENPFTFPLRMRPQEAVTDAASEWPAISATATPVDFSDWDRAALSALPLVFTVPEPDSQPEQLLRRATSRAVQSEDGSTKDLRLDARMQMANICYPNELYGTTGFDAHFRTVSIQGKTNKLTVFEVKHPNFNIDTVFRGEGLRAHAPKLHRILESILKSNGISFVFSRYITAGAVPMAIALERAGFQRRLGDGSLSPLLKGVKPPAPICALCGETQHERTSHEFKPACYVFLTSDDTLAPQYKNLVRQATTWVDPITGPVGGEVKVILGSQVASEGLDLKCVREVHVLDAWYHLNRIEQIVGRGIRFCSHTALRAVEDAKGIPRMSLNNCLIYLHALNVPDTEERQGFETADLYAYRLAIGKARMIGLVQRVLKTHSWDCNLELEAMTFVGLPTRTQIDAQNNRNDTYSLNDQDYTTYCDYHVCKHQCAVESPADDDIDESTYDVDDARRQVLSKQSLVRGLFRETVAVPEQLIQRIFEDLPFEIRSEALMEILDGRQFKFRRPDGVEGYLMKKAGYVVFQPIAIADTEIPMAMRYGRAFQIRRRFMEPSRAVFDGILPRKIETTKAVKTIKTVVADDDDDDDDDGSDTETTVEVPENKIFAAWETWVAFVNGSKPPVDANPLWPWVFRHFSSFPKIKQIALRYWFDKQNYNDQKALYERGLMQKSEPLFSVIEPDVYQSATMSIYCIFNPVSQEIELFSKKELKFERVPSNSVASIMTEINKRNPIITWTGDVGKIIGFLAAKDGLLKFKTLDTTVARKTAVAGALCDGVSNLSGHLDKLRALNSSNTDPVLKSLMLPDSEDFVHPIPTEKTRLAENPTDIKSLTHKPICLYLELVTRLMDVQRVGGKRWFLSSVAAAQAGLKARASGKGK